MRKFGMFSRERKKSFVWVQVEQQRFFQFLCWALQQWMNKYWINVWLEINFHVFFSPNFSLVSSCAPTIFRHRHIHTFISCTTCHNLQNFFSLSPWIEYIFKRVHMKGDCGNFPNFYFIVKNIWKFSFQLFFFFFYCQSLNIEWWRERVEFPRLCISTRVKETRTEIQVKFRVCCVREKNVECEVSVPVLFFFEVAFCLQARKLRSTFKSLSMRWKVFN